MQKRIYILVKGLVQGVGYRYFCGRKAAEYGLKGYARNLPDGDVEVEAEGESGMLSEFIKDLKAGPFNASVRSVSAEELPLKNYSEFKLY
ncbi:MAG TPA: acylphosphatase [Ignavibacteria bacterium]|nr:acylphosphatase [Ignavibacteria bacterium]